MSRTETLNLSVLQQISPAPFSSLIEKAQELENPAKLQFLPFLREGSNLYENSNDQLHSLKNIFSKHKFNFVELSSKLEFLETLKRDPATWQIDKSEDDQQTHGRLKQQFQSIRQANQDLETQISQAIDQLVDDYNNWMAEKIYFKSDLSCTIRLANTKDMETHMSEQSFMHKTETPRHRKSDPKLNQSINLEMLLSSEATTDSSFGVLEVEELDPNEFTIRLVMDSNSSIFRLTVEYEQPGKVVLPTAAQLSPSTVPIKDIVDYAIETCDLKFLVREVRWRINNWNLRTKEIESLNSRFENVIEIDKDDGCLLRIKNKNHQLAMLFVPLDYPQAPAEIETLVDTFVSHEFAPGSFVTLSSIVQVLMSSCCRE